MNYLDANVFIYAAIGIPVDRKVVSAKELLKKIVRGEMRAVTSFLSWDEFVWIVRKIEGSNVAKEKGREFLLMPNLKFCIVDERVIIKSQEIVERYNLHPRDAIHAASAIVYDVEGIVSDDPDFDSIRELKRMKLG